MIRLIQIQCLRISECYCRQTKNANKDLDVEMLDYCKLSTDPNSSQPHFLNEIDAVCIAFNPSCQDLNQPHGRTRQTSDVINDISRQKQYRPVVSALCVLKEWGTRPQLLVCLLSPQTIEALCLKSVFQVEQVYIVIMLHRVSHIGCIVGAQKPSSH